MRPAERVDALGRLGVAHDELLDLGDLAVVHPQPQRNQGRLPALRLTAVLLYRADERDLAGRRVADEQSIRPLGAHAPPEPVADVQPLAVLGEPHVLGERHRARIIVHDGVEIAVDPVLEAAAITLLRRGRSRRQQSDQSHGEQTSHVSRAHSPTPVVVVVDRRAPTLGRRLIRRRRRRACAGRRPRRPRRRKARRPRAAPRTRTSARTERDRRPPRRS